MSCSTPCCWFGRQQHAIWQLSSLAPVERIVAEPLLDSAAVRRMSGLLARLGHQDEDFLRGAPLQTRRSGAGRDTCRISMTCS